MTSGLLTEIGTCEYSVPCLLRQVGKGGGWRTLLGNGYVYATKRLGASMNMVLGGKCLFAEIPRVTKSRFVHTLR